MLANYMLGKKSLGFSLNPIEVRALFETEEMKSEVLTKSCRELGMDKSTL